MPEKKSLRNEYQLVEYLKAHWRKHFPPSFKLIGFDVPTFGVISQKKIGLIDMILLRGKHKKFLIEIKYNSRVKAGDFWESLKILGYAKNEYLKYSRKIHDIIPTIMVRKEILSYDFLVLLKQLKIAYISFTIEKGIPQFNMNLY